MQKKKYPDLADLTAALIVSAPVSILAAVGVLGAGLLFGNITQAIGWTLLVFSIALPLVAFVTLLVVSRDGGSAQKEPQARMAADEGEESGESDNQKLTYLATPYSHDDANVMVQRFNIANRVAATMLKQGIHVYSPISHSHPIAMQHGLPKGWDFWERHDRLIIEHCGKVVVLMQDGWRESIGVEAEIQIAEEMGIPVEYMEVPL